MAEPSAAEELVASLAETAAAYRSRPTPKRARLVVPAWFMAEAEREGFDVQAEADAGARRFGFAGADVEVAEPL